MVGFEMSMVKGESNGRSVAGPALMNQTGKFWPEVMSRACFGRFAEATAEMPETNPATRRTGLDLCPQASTPTSPYRCNVAPLATMFVLQPGDTLSKSHIHVSGSMRHYIS